MLKRIFDGHTEIPRIHDTTKKYPLTQKSGSDKEVLQTLCKGCVVSYAAFLFLS